MTKARIINLLFRCIQHENNATSPEACRYWGEQYTKFRKLAQSKGWPV